MKPPSKNDQTISSVTADTTGNHGYAAILVDRGVDRTVLGTLIRFGWPEKEKQDGLGETRLRAVLAFGRRVKPPQTVEAMAAFCAKIAKDLAIDRVRKKKTERKYCIGLCPDPDEYTPIEPGGEQRDPVDASRQLDVAAELFLEGRMPEEGVEILEGIASRCSYREVAKDLGITSQAVQGRLKTMRKLFAGRIADKKMG